VWLPVSQTCPPPQSVVLRQLPDTQAPPVHTWFAPYPDTHSAVVVHPTQAKLLQSFPPAHSGAVRHWPEMQTLFWHRCWAPNSVTHWLSPLQAPQACVPRSQTWPPLQLLLSWQFPLTQTLLTQMCPLPYSLAHCPSPEQPPQKSVPVLQMSPPDAQSPAMWQLPGTQAPFWQTCEAP
jgi:hypothetical protein